MTYFWKFSFWKQSYFRDFCLNQLERSNRVNTYFWRHNFEIFLYNNYTYEAITFFQMSYRIWNFIWLSFGMWPGTILFLYHEESLVSSNLNSKLSILKTLCKHVALVNLIKFCVTDNWLKKGQKEITCHIISY